MWAKGTWRATLTVSVGVLSLIKSLGAHAFGHRLIDSFNTEVT